ncbi:phage tail assembly chaperone [Vibrio splendidus]|nr:phage tail assembly chaperone [Vibrio splendidus]
MQEPVVLSVTHNDVTFFNVPLGGKLVTPHGDTITIDIPLNVIQTAYESQEWELIRIRRDKLISSTDKEYLRHHRELRNGKVPDDEDNPTTLSSGQLSDLDTYIQALADIPQVYTNPDNVVWPERPTQ